MIPSCNAIQHSQRVIKSVLTLLINDGGGHKFTQVYCKSNKASPLSEFHVLNPACTLQIVSEHSLTLIFWHKKTQPNKKTTNPKHHDHRMTEWLYNSSFSGNFFLFLHTESVLVSDLWQLLMPVFPGKLSISYTWHSAAVKKREVHWCYM